MQRVLVLLYGVGCHLLFLGVFAWMACFVGDLYLADTIDSPSTAFSWGALSTNLGLIVLFGLQHSIMARPRFKAWWVRTIPVHLERSTYVLVSCVVMAAFMLAWRPMSDVVWDITAPAARTAVWVLFAAGWLMVPAVSLLINHFDLFGTRQAWLHFKGRAYTHLPFGTPGLYRVIRHPLYVGWGLAFWATPTMSIGHLVFAVGMSAYMRIAIPIEERDLIDIHGETYATYRQRVPALLPGFRKKAGAG